MNTHQGGLKVEEPSPPFLQRIITFKNYKECVPCQLQQQW